ncbi:SpoIIE family protein phosphatase [Streptomyces viridiviolaceus]
MPELVLLRAVFDHLGAGVYATDTSGRITAANARAGEITGRPAEQALGQDLHDLVCRAEDGTVLSAEQCRVHTAIRAVLTSGRPAEGSEEFFLRDDGTLVPVLWAATALHVEGLTAGAVLVFRDFSTRRAAQQETAAYLAALEELTARLSLIAEISEVLVSTLETGEVLRRTSRLLVPGLADWAAVDLFRADTEELERVAIHTRDDADAAAGLEGPLPPLPEPSGSHLVRVLRGIQPVLLDPDILARETGSPLATTHQDLFDQLGGHSAIVVPLYSRGKVFGSLTVGRTTGSPPYTDAEVTVLADIGRRAGLVVDNAQLFAQQRHVAEAMQRQLLTPLPHVDPLGIAARYRPAQAVAEVGGDWYDAFGLPGGVTALVIGDVAGHDLPAAAHMAELRNMLRALAWDRRGPPSLIMEHLDDAMTHTSGAPIATAFLAHVEGSQGGPWRLRWTNAGHPPPLLITEDGARYLQDHPDPPLGMSDTLGMELHRHDGTDPLPPGSTLLLYTDGLVEDRARPIDIGMAKLRLQATALAHRGVEDFCDELLERIDPDGDDVALLALRMPPAGAGSAHGAAPPRVQDA